jgi:hypothetical protein
MSNTLYEEKEVFFVIRFSDGYYFVMENVRRKKVQDAKRYPTEQDAFDYAKYWFASTEYKIICVSYILSYMEAYEVKKEFLE